MLIKLWMVVIPGLILARILYGIFTTLTSPLRKVPGPFWTRWTKLWYASRVYKGRFEYDNLALHQKYGPIVRIAPNMYSISSPEVVQTVYGIGSKYAKSDWYIGWRHPAPDRWTLFPDQDMKRHADTRKRFQAMYSLSTMVSYESYVEECAEIFQKRLDELASSNAVVNMGHWFQCYAFDVIGDITYSARFGFLDDGKDRGGLMEALDKLGTYSTMMGIWPRLHAMVFDLASRLSWTGAYGRQYMMNFIQAKLDARVKENKGKGVIEAKTDQEGQPQDFLDKLLIANKENPEKVTMYHVWMMGNSNLIAGSDTTATSLSGTLYYLLKNPKCMEKLRAEISQMEKDGRCGKDAVSFKESQDMPYLNAVMKEAFRLHSATGLPLWRQVPPGGATICGQYFPAGTDVGLNTWVAHYNEDIFGKDAKQFRPERWLEGGENSPEKLKEMEKYYMPFGLGSRTCIGRHISFLEMSKLIPQIVRRYDFELEHPHRPWKTVNHWFVKPVDFDVRVRPRKS